MLKLPDGFDYAVLLSDFWSIIIPFVVISTMFLGGRIIIKALNP